MSEWPNLADALAWLAIGILTGLLLAQLVGDRRFTRRIAFLQQQLSQSRARHERMQSACRRARLSTWTFTPDDGVMTWDGAPAGVARPSPPTSALDLWMQRIDAGHRDTLLTALRQSAHGDRIYLRLPAADDPDLRLHVVGERSTDHKGRPLVEGVCIDERISETATPGTVELQEVMDLFPLPLWLVDPGGRLRQVNRAWLQICPDITPDQPREWLSKVHPDDVPRWMHDLGEAMVDGEPLVEELRLRTVHRGMQWHMVEAVPIRDHSGRITVWSYIAINVDERRRAADAHSATAQRLTSMLESMADGFLLVDNDWRVIFANRAADQLLALRRDTLAGAVLWDVAQGLRGGPFERELRRAAQQQRSALLDQRYATTGQVLELRAQPAEDGLAIHLRDVTESRSRDSQLRLLEHAVARLNDMILITDTEVSAELGTRIVFVNDTFARRTGYEASELIGKPTSMFASKETRPETIEEILQTMQAWGHLRTEVAFKARDGEALWVEMDLLPLADESGWYAHWVAVLRDITERRRMNQKMLAMNRIEAIGRIASGMAHDFNNLLTVILGNGDMLAEQLSDRPESQRHLRGVLTAAERGTALTRRLLALARQQALHPVRIDLRSLLSDLLPLLDDLLGEEIALHYTPPPSLGTVVADQSELETAIVNLCVNARDAMPQGGRLQIEVADENITQERWALSESMPPGAYVRLTITDTGEGIPQDLIDRVADPFFTTKSGGRSGLGLATVHGFMRQSGGYIAIHSTPGAGTRVDLHLPLGEPALVLPSPPVLPPAPDRASAHRRARILLVEDNAELRAIATEQLRRLGYEVHAAATGQSALDMLPQIGSVDLLFTDMVMPGGLNGPQLADQVRRSCPTTRVLYTSGYTDGSFVPHLQNDLTGRLLMKPYRAADLARKVAQALA